MSSHSKNTPASAGNLAAQSFPTNSIISAMLRTSRQVSDLIFSPGRAPQVELNGQLIPVKIQQIPQFSAEDTAKIAADLLGNNLTAARKLREEGSCDISYSLPPLARFRVNIFTQRGSCAIVMRVIPTQVPDFESLNLPPQLQDLVELKNGIVLVTGPTGSGKSSTLAAVLNKINEEKPYHVVTIEDPIEFLYQHKKATIHQRELYSDTPSFALALRAAMRQAPKVILVGEMRDRETIEIALEAAETGHLVFSTLHTIDAAKTVERIIGVFPLGEQHLTRARLSKAFRYIISQRLIARKDGSGRIVAVEVLKSTLRTREYVEKGEAEGKTLLDAMRDGDQDGMQHFDAVIEKFIREDVVDFDTGMAYATNPGNMRLALADYIEAMSKPARVQAVAPAARPIEPAPASRQPAAPAAAPVMRLAGAGTMPMAPARVAVLPAPTAASLAPVAPPSAHPGTLPIPSAPASTRGPRDLVFATNAPLAVAAPATAEEEPGLPPEFQIER